MNFDLFVLCDGDGFYHLGRFEGVDTRRNTAHQESRFYQQLGNACRWGERKGEGGREKGEGGREGYQSYCEKTDIYKTTPEMGTPL